MSFSARIDALFRSAAISCGSRVIGVILGGALDDGTSGLWAIKDRGRLAFVQDPLEAEHASMPLSAIEHVGTDCVGPVKLLAQQITQHCGETVDGSSIGAAPDSMVVEHAIASDADGMETGVMELGKVSRYTCPECHGVLVQIENGPIARFRCHTGHAFSIKTLLAEINLEIDRGLWQSLSTIEEKVLLLSQAAKRAKDAGNIVVAERYQRLVDASNEGLAPLRTLVKDPAFFDSGERS